MQMITPEYLDWLGLSRNVSREEIESALSAQEDRCRVLLKIPTKRIEGAERLELIAAVRSQLSKVEEIEPEDPFEQYEFEEPELSPPQYGERPHKPIKRSAAIIESEPVEDEGTLGEIRLQL